MGVMFKKCSLEYRLWTNPVTIVSKVKRGKIHVNVAPHPNPILTFILAETAIVLTEVGLTITLRVS